MPYLPASVLSILRESAADNAVTVPMMQHGGQYKPIVSARRQAAFHMRYRLKLSFPMIGAYLNLHHSRAMSLVRQYREREMSNKTMQFRTVLRGVKSKLVGGKIEADPQAFHSSRAAAEVWAREMLARVGSQEGVVVEIFEQREDLIGTIEK